MLRGRGSVVIPLTLGSCLECSLSISHIYSVLIAVESRRDKTLVYYRFSLSLQHIYSANEVSTSVASTTPYGLLAIIEKLGMRQNRWDLI